MKLESSYANCVPVKVESIDAKHSTVRPKPLPPRIKCSPVKVHHGSRSEQSSVFSTPSVTGSDTSPHNAAADVAMVSEPPQDSSLCPEMSEKPEQHEDSLGLVRASDSEAGDLGTRPKHWSTAGSGSYCGDMLQDFAIDKHYATVQRKHAAHRPSDNVMERTTDKRQDVKHSDTVMERTTDKRQDVKHSDTVMERTTDKRQDVKRSDTVMERTTDKRQDVGLVQHDVSYATNQSGVKSQVISVNSVRKPTMQALRQDTSHGLNSPDMQHETSTHHDSHPVRLPGILTHNDKTAKPAAQALTTAKNTSAVTYSGMNPTDSTTKISTLSLQKKKNSNQVTQKKDVRLKYCTLTKDDLASRNGKQTVTSKTCQTTERRSIPEIRSPDRKSCKVQESGDSKIVPSLPLNDEGCNLNDSVRCIHLKGFQVQSESGEDISEIEEGELPQTDEETESDSPPIVSQHYPNLIPLSPVAKKPVAKYPVFTQATVPVHITLSHSTSQTLMRGIGVVSYRDYTTKSSYQVDTLCKLSLVILC